MERYQEALDNIYFYCGHANYDKYLNPKIFDELKTFQELVDILKEYNVIQSNIRKILLAGNQFEHLIEKVNKYDEKETPKKPDTYQRHIKLPKKYFCPNCQKNLYSGQNYCDECGTAIDWSEEICQQK